MKKTHYIRLFALFAIFCVIPSLTLSQPAEVRIDMVSSDCPTFVDDIYGLDYKTGIGAKMFFNIDARSTVRQDGCTIGFSAYDPTGAALSVEITEMQMSPDWGGTKYWNIPSGVLTLNLDGSLPEFWLTGGSGVLGGGFTEPDYVNVLSFYLLTADSGTYCIDSAFYPPSGEWIFSPGGPPILTAGGGDISVGGVSPSALCFTTYTIPCPGPQFTTCIDSISSSYCTPVIYDLEASIPGVAEGPDKELYRSACGSVEGGAVNYSVQHTGFGSAAVGATGVVIYLPSIEDTNSVIEITTFAEGDVACYGSAACVTSVYITTNKPQITCPPDFAAGQGALVTTPPTTVSDLDACESHTWSLVSVTPAPVTPVSVDPATGAVTIEMPTGGGDTDYDVCIAASDGILADTCCFTVTALACLGCGCCIVAGDADNSWSVTISDVTFLIARIFSGGAAPNCCEQADADGSGAITIGDVTYLIARIFSGGPEPVCGPGGMACETH